MMAKESMEAIADEAVTPSSLRAKSSQSKKNRHRADARPAAQTSRPSFPVVGIGASAGGLEAFTQLLKALPADTGMAFILIQHLDPAHSSFLSQALGKTTSMKVVQVESGMRVEPDHVYVIPPNADVALAGDELVLVERGPPAQPHLPVDSFLRSLAHERGSQAIGVVLSGTASDGTAGLRAIKGEHGITLVQDPQSAKFSGMPQSAIDAGVVDYTLPLPLLAEELVRLSRHPYLAVDPELPPEQVDQDALNQIFLVVREAVGVDYTEYKPATLQRRLARRMALRKTKSLGDYLRILRQDPQEARLLHEDILIHVTSFFRDPEVFEALKKRVFPELLLRPSPEGAPIRIWVAGCSTGEEVYSLAIALLEFMDESPCPRTLRIFGSDISEQAIRTARQGLYPDSVVRELSEERRSRYFVKADGGYRVHKIVRELCVFVRHDLARDPPFSKLDLIACRNVLIYFAAALQKRIVATFHYCLNQPGYLVLGRTEGVVGFGRFFFPADKTNKIFARTTLPSRLRFGPPAKGQPIAGQPLDRVSLEQHRSTVDVTRYVDRLLLAKYAPAGLIVNEAMEVLQFRGHTGPYLEPAAGEPQNNVLKMARPGLLSALRDAFAQAKKEMAPVRKHSVAIGDDGSTRTCDVVVIPITAFAGAKEPLYVVPFEDSEADVGRPVGRVSGDRTRLQQVLWNLLANAVKFTPAHGCVSVTLERADGHALIEVRDTGSGIDPAFLPDVFNRFTQEDSTTSRRYGGLGLGLAIVRHIVESPGGTVRAASEGKGKGATFQVSLPLLSIEDETVVARAPTALESGSAPGDAAGLRGLRILVVDDDLAAGGAVQEILRQAGAEVSAVASAEEARRAMAELHPQLIVCDIAMPGENGYSFIRRLRQSGPARDAQVPAIALTALAGEEDRRRSFAAGFQEHLSKPVDIDRLVQTVSALAARRLRSTVGEPR